MRHARSWLRNQTYPDAAVRLDPPRVAQLAAQPGDMEVQSLASVEDAQLADRVEDPTAPHDDPRVGGQQDQHLVLLRRQRDQPVVKPHLAGTFVDAEAP